MFDELRVPLSAAETAQARDYLDHNEFGPAFETALDHLSEKHVPITGVLRERVAKTAAYSKRAVDCLRFCPDVDQSRWRSVDNTWEGLEIEERLPGPRDVAWLVCNRCPEVLFRFDSHAAMMGKVPYRCGILATDGGIAVFTEAVAALNHLERCWT